MLGLVAANIANGGSYGRYNYNCRIAEHLGLNEFVVNAKLSGMTYAQIKETVRKTASGMNISRSTVKRMMKKHTERGVAARQQGQTKARRATNAPPKGTPTPAPAAQPSFETASATA